MVNIGFFYDGSDTPSGYTEIDSSYRDRLIIAGGTPLETGGSGTHTHTTSSWSCGGPSSTTLISGGSDPNSGVGHSHNSGTINIGEVSHLPPYKNLRVILKPYDSWNKTVPSGSIVFCENVPDGYTRYDNGSSYYIRISSTAGGTGGNSGVHSHTVSGQTGTPTTSGGSTSSGKWISAAGHQHSFSGTTSTSSSPDYYYWSCGLIKASDQVKLEVNCIVLADGTLSDTIHWEEVSGASGRFLRVSSTNSITTGGSSLSFSHSHSSFSCTTDTTPSNIQANGSVYQLATDTHTHSISFNINSSDPIPSYVRLKLYKLIAPFGIGSFVNACII